MDSPPLAQKGNQLLRLGRNPCLHCSDRVQNNSINAINPSTEKPITVINNIQGDVNPSTLKALVAVQEQIIRAAKREIMSDTLRNRGTSRVR